MAVNCNFTDIDREVKSQLIQKCSSSKLRDEALLNSYSLSELLIKGRTQDAAFRQRKLMEGVSATGAGTPGSSSSATVNKMTAQKPKKKMLSRRSESPKVAKSSNKTCYNCGGTWPHGKGKKCPAYGKKCNKCGVRNHFAAQCKKSGPVHSVEQIELASNSSIPVASESDEAYEFGELFEVNEENPRVKEAPSTSSHVRKAYKCDLLVNGVKMTFQVDTGASTSLMNENSYKELGHTKKLHQSAIILKTYTGEKIVPKGSVWVDVDYKEQHNNLLLTVVPGDGPNLLGRDWLEKIKLNWEEVVNFVGQAIDKSELKHVLDSYQEVFQEKLGCLKGTTVNLQVSDDAKPVFLKARPISFSYRTKVLEELDRLERDGVIRPVTFSQWATPIVPVLKSNGSVRICGDFKLTVNKFAKPDCYPLPVIDELFTKLSGGTLFSKLDLSHAYQQLVLDEPSQLLTTINTPKGLYAYNRLPFGVSAAPGIFQRTLEGILQGVPHTAVYLDDVLITGTSMQDHISNLKTVLSRLKEHGLRLKSNKCSFLKPSVTYLGHVIDETGIRPSESKLQGISDAPEPQNISELRSYLGLINYYHKFIENASLLLKPLYDLLQKDVKWVWGKPQQEAFAQSKAVIKSDSVLVHYDPSKPLVLETDASPYGVGSVISHSMDDGSLRPIAFASRTLAPPERKYAQIEREGLAIIFGLKYFHKYLHGRSFTIKTDHKPLLGLLGQDKQTSHMASARIQRWSLALGSYDYRLEYIPGTQITNADALSRLPSPKQPNKVPDPQESILSVEFCDNTPITHKEIALETSHNPLLSKVVNYVLRGWPPKSSEPDLQPYFVRRSELTVQQDCLLWGSRVIIPPKFRDIMLSELHESHPGIVKMKLISRAYLWWPNLDHDIESTVRECTQCQQQLPKPASAPLCPWEYPQNPMERVHIDYAGPFEHHMILVMIDAHSKFIDAHIMKTSTSRATIDRLRHTFALLGVPKVIVSDNGTPFVSQEFQEFCTLNGIKHTCVSPYHPASNGLAERAVQTLKLGLKKCTDGTLESRLYRFLLKYHNTPQGTTGSSPAVLLQKRALRTRLDLIRPCGDEKVKAKQEIMKQQHDRHAKDRTFLCGDPILAYNFHGTPKWIRGTVQQVLGPVSYLVLLDDGRQWKRHIDHLQYCHVKVSPENPPPNPQPAGVYPPVLTRVLNKPAIPRVEEAIKTQPLKESVPISTPRKPPKLIHEHSTPKPNHSAKTEGRSLPPPREPSKRTVKPPNKLNLFVDCSG